MNKNTGLERNFENNEIRSHVKLCTSRGNVNMAARGWSRIPMQTCNLSHHFLRKKKWNYWCITGKDFLFSVTISDVDYAGLIFAYFIDYRTNEMIEKTITVPLARGIYMGDTVRSLCSFQNKDADVQFVTDERGSSISMSWLNFYEGKDLCCELTLKIPQKHETLNVVVPWNDTDLFQFTSKQNALPAEGYFSLGEDKYEFKKDTAYGCLDFGRGIWPYSISWNWGSFSAKVGADVVGLNMGAQWTDGTGITENALCINGKLTKIKERILFIYDTNDFMKPWKIRTEDSSMIMLDFVPFFERNAKSNFIIIKSATHQMAFQK